MVFLEQSLACYHFWGTISNPCGLWCYRRSLLQLAVANVAMSIVSWLTKHCKTSLNFCKTFKHREPLVKHHETHEHLPLDPSGIFLPETELLQSPFRTEFSMGSRLRRYRRSMRHHRWFMRSYRQFLRSYRQFLRSYSRSLRRCRDLPIPEAIGGRAVADAAMPIIAQLAKHHKTLLNIVKHHETHVKHCDTS